MSQAPLFVQPVETRFPGVAECRKTPVWYTCPSLYTERTTLVECLPNKQSASSSSMLWATSSAPFSPPWTGCNQRRYTHKSPLPFCHHDAEIIERQESPPRLPGRSLRPPLS